MTHDEYATLMSAYLLIFLLSIGGIAMLVRSYIQHKQKFHRAGNQFVKDVKAGRGFTFHNEFRRTGDAEPERRPEPPRPQPAEHKTPTKAPERKVLPVRAWLDLLNHKPDEVPQVFIEGGTGTGKTTFVKALLKDRAGLISIIGVKPDDNWGSGYVYRSTERDKALEQLKAEIARRIDNNDKSGLTVVFDDFTRLAASHSVAVDIYKEVADIGRSLRIRLVLIARGRLVKALGAAGESDLHEHFVFVRLNRSHQAILEYDEDEFQLDTSTVQESSHELPNARFWQPEQSRKTETTSSIISSMLNETDKAVSSDMSTTKAGMDTGIDTGIASISHQEDHTSKIQNPEIPVSPEDGIPAHLTPEIIQILYKAGLSKNKIASLLTGSKQRRLEIINEALQEVTTEKVA